MKNKIVNVKFYRYGTTFSSKIYRYAMSNDETTRKKLKPHNKYFLPKMSCGSCVFYDEMKVVSLESIPGPYPAGVTSVIELINAPERIIKTYRR